MSEIEIKKEIKDCNGKVIATKVTTGAASAAPAVEPAAKAEQIVVTENRKTEAPAAKAKARVGIMETAFRDAHQSIMATRLRTDDMLPICEAMDEVGYHSIEMWGGATFDSACVRGAASGRIFCSTGICSITSCG